MSEKRELVIVHYTEHFEKTCRDGCTVIDSADSDFRMNLVQSLEDAADYIAHKLFKSPGAEQANLVFENFEDLKYNANTDRNYTERGVDSISVLCSEDPYNNSWIESRELLQSQLRTLVSTKLKFMTDEKEDRRKEQMARKNKEDHERREKDEKEQLERLKRKYEKE